MRVSQETKRKTRQAILYAARAQFQSAGYETSTTREIARMAGIAAGTLFNYFPSKEALGLALILEADADALSEFAANRRLGKSLEERLFAHIAIQLRHLSPTREWAGPILDTALSPLRIETPDGLAGSLRRRHLERVVGWLASEPGLRAGCAESSVDLHLYWSLYLGVIRFWAGDDSHNQEATLALLDRSIGLFCNSLREA